MPRLSDFTHVHQILFDSKMTLVIDSCSVSFLLYVRGEWCAHIGDRYALLSQLDDV